MKIPPTLGNAFAKRKQAILSQLSVPEDEYTDASPKGSVDAGIRHLIDQINAHAGLVTTSSCAGRVTNERFVENQKRIARFSTAIDAAFAPPKAKAGWEDAQARRERKRQEGLKRREELRNNNKPVDESSLDQMLQQEDVM
ncbi:hypothetical protein N0V88_003534 [Collariella sp. IMI 366227]|nr:hypothetical protein N0V88_003534 [Collariella sp. IMI 366227]